MYDRAPRKLGQGSGTTSQGVGPGSYNVEAVSRAKLKFDGYAPFGSLTVRETFIGTQDNNAGIPQPGPGYYDHASVIAAIDSSKGTSVLRSRAPRFEPPKEELPGPGAYDVSKLVVEKAKQPAQSEAAATAAGARIRYIRNPEPPSIPIPLQAYGYEESDEGRLVRQLPPERDISIGPAYYSPHLHQQAAPTRKYKGTHFGSLTSKRSLNLGGSSTETPGPGAYNLANESRSAAFVENLNASRDKLGELVLRQPSSNAEMRFTEEVEKRALKDRLPGPGHYLVPRTFEEMQHRPNPEVEPPPFGVQSRRFHEGKRAGPSPGDYNDPRTALDLLKRPTGLKHSPFGVTDMRFKRNDRSSSAPGPGSYMIADGIGAVTMRKLIMESAHRGAFGSSAARNLQLDSRPVRDVADLPGPANYMPKSKPYMLKYEPMSAAFSSMTLRFQPSSDLDENLPGPGAYEPGESYDATQGRITPPGPRTEMGRKRRRAFLISSERFRPGTVTGGQHVDTDVPGPGVYDSFVNNTAIKNDIGYSIGRSQRFLDKVEPVPGPAAYSLSVPVRDSTFRATYNVTLGAHGAKSSLSFDAPLPKGRHRGKLEGISSETGSGVEALGTSGLAATATPMNKLVPSPATLGEKSPSPGGPQAKLAVALSASA